MKLPRFRAVSILAFVAMLAAACGGGGGGTSFSPSPLPAPSPVPPSPSPSPAAPPVTELLEGALDGQDGREAIYGDAGVPGPNGGPRVDIGLPHPFVVNGGAGLAELAADAEFDRILIAVGGTRGHLEVQLPRPTLRAEVLFLVAPDAHESLGAVEEPGILDLSFAVGLADRYGPEAYAEVTLIPVRAGDPQVTVTWSAGSDVDLQVTDPWGEKVHVRNPLAASGGRVDLDANNCTPDGVGLESISWPADAAVRGGYAVDVDLAECCEDGATPYIVTIHYADTVEVHRGSFPGCGAEKQRVATFLVP